MVIALFLLLAIFLAANIPIYISLSFSVLLSFAIFTKMPLLVVIERMFAGIDKFALMSIPFFVFAANIMSLGGISRRIIKVANTLVGSFKGGLAMTSVLACMFFGAISGSSPATVVAMGSLLFPALINANYPERFSIGLIVASGSIALIIPPSITMIIYGAVTGVSVGALFVSGFGAGVIYGLSFMIYSYYYAKRNGIPIQTRATFKEILSAIAEAKYGLGIPVIIIGGIYGGVFTPTEAAAVGTVYAMVVALFIHGELNLRGLFRVAVISAATTAQVLIILAGASVFSWILTSQGITVAIANTIMKISTNPYVILFLINIVLLIAGMFIDGASAIMILAPLLYPIAVNVGIDPLHLGIVVVVNLSIGMFTPPFGLNLFVASSATGRDMPQSKIIPGVMPFIWTSIIALMIITYLPDISLWLPRMLYGVR